MPSWYARSRVRSFVEAAVLTTLLALLAFAALVTYATYIAPLGGLSKNCTVGDSDELTSLPSSSQPTPIAKNSTNAAVAAVPTNAAVAAVPTNAAVAAVPTNAAAVPTNAAVAAVPPNAAVAAVSTNATVAEADQRKARVNRWIRTVYSYRPYKIRAECATAPLRDVAAFHRELAPPNGQFREFVADTGSVLLPPGTDYAVDPDDLWRVDLREIVRFALLRPKSFGSSSPSFSEARNFWTAYVSSLDIVTWKQEFCDRLPAELARLLDANDEETLLRLGVLLATKYIGPLGSVAANYPSVLHASFDRLDDHVVYVKFLLLRRLILSRDPSGMPVYGDLAKQRSHDDAVATSELRRGDAATATVAEAIRADFNESSSPRFLAMRATAEPWLPRMPAIASAVRVCASNGICYDVREDAHVRTYDREENALVNHRSRSLGEDSFYLVDGSRFTMYRATDKRNEHALYRLPGSHPNVVEMTDIDADGEDAEIDAIVQRHVRMTLLHGHEALLHIRVCLFDERNEVVPLPATEPIACDNVNGVVRVVVPPRHTAIVLLQRYVYDPLRARLESSWLDIDASNLRKREIFVGDVNVRFVD